MIKELINSKAIMVLAFIEFLVGIVLLTAATAKLTSFGDLIGYLQSIPWFPRSSMFASVLAVVVISLEAALGVIYIQGNINRFVQWCVLVLFTGFLAWQILLLFPFLGAVPKTCPCFGKIDAGLGLNPYYPLIRDLIFCVLVASSFVFRKLQDYQAAAA